MLQTLLMKQHAYKCSSKTSDIGVLKGRNFAQNGMVKTCS